MTTVATVATVTTVTTVTIVTIVTSLASGAGRTCAYCATERLEFDARVDWVNTRPRLSLGGVFIRFTG